MKTNKILRAQTILQFHIWHTSGETVSFLIIPDKFQDNRYRLNLSESIQNANFLICDVFCQNLSYGGKNTVGLGQKPCVMHGVWPGLWYFLLMNIYSEHFVTPCAVTTINIITNVCKQLILEGTVCSSIRQVFADDVTCLISQQNPIERRFQLWSHQRVDWEMRKFS